MHNLEGMKIVDGPSYEFFIESEKIVYRINICNEVRERCYELEGAALATIWHGFTQCYSVIARQYLNE